MFFDHSLLKHTIHLLAGAVGPGMWPLKSQGRQTYSVMKKWNLQNTILHVVQGMFPALGLHTVLVQEPWSPISSPT